MGSVNVSDVANFAQVFGNRHQYARDWKARTGGKMLGYFCNWIPEEIFYAAGFLPVRILGNHEPQDIEFVEHHISAMWCSYCRDCLAQGLLGRYDYLDGIATAHGCYQIRQTFTSWRRNIPNQLSFYPYVPYSLHTVAAQTHLPKELHRIKVQIEESIAQPISHEALQDAIEIYNTNRQLMKQIYELRKADVPPVSGSEILEMVLSGMCMDKKEHNDLLKRAVEELPQRTNRQLPRARLMLVGSETDQVDFYKLIESLGAEVVIDDDCVGTRYFWNETPENEDPIAALAQRYVDRIPCPLYDTGKERRRFSSIRSFATDYDVQGVILIVMKFCDTHEYDTPAIEKMFRKMGIPTLRLETDVTNSDGPLRTRIEAFLEMLDIEAL